MKPLWASLRLFIPVPVQIYTYLKSYDEIYFKECRTTSVSIFKAKNNLPLLVFALKEYTMKTFNTLKAYTWQLNFIALHTFNKGG